MNSREVAPAAATLYRVECLAGHVAQCWKGGEELTREDAVIQWNRVMATLKQFDNTGDTGT